jgi:MiaB-like tRNA modifying enzyme
MKVHIQTYGCTLNQADSEIISSVMNREGIKIAERDGDADVVVVNTCTVKKATAQKILYKLNNLDSAGRKVVVTGCMAGANQDLIEKYAPNASIVTTPNTDRIADVALDAAKGKRTVLNTYKKSERLALLEPTKSIIAKIGVNDGCSSSCSFCETKFARGPLNSFPEQLILNAIRNSVMNGAREVQLTSQDMGAYGIDRKTNAAELMAKIAAIDGDFKVRIGMLNPEHLGRYFDELVEQLKNTGRFYSFVHLPVQSGSNMVLRKMKRDCNIEEFDAYVKELRGRIPGITIETDIIVGFPTETDSDFEETVEFIKRTKPDVTNISRFGARPHASASKLKQHESETVNLRSIKLSRVMRSVQHELNDRFIGKRLNLIITESNDKSFNGRTQGYKQVVVPKGEEIGIGSVMDVLIKSASANVLYA